MASFNGLYSIYDPTDHKAAEYEIVKDAQVKGMKILPDARENGSYYLVSGTSDQNLSVFSISVSSKTCRFNKYLESKKYGCFSF